MYITWPRTWLCNNIYDMTTYLLHSNISHRKVHVSSVQMVFIMFESLIKSTPIKCLIHYLKMTFTTCFVWFHLQIQLCGRWHFYLNKIICMLYVSFCIRLKYFNRNAIYDSVLHCIYERLTTLYSLRLIIFPFKVITQIFYFYSTINLYMA